MNKVPGRGPSHFKYLIIGEAPGQTEFETGEPFRGPTGRMLTTQILLPNGITEAECYFDNVIETKPKLKNPDNDEIQAALPDLYQRIWKLRKDNKNHFITLAVGNTALKALTAWQRDGITKWRGSLLPNRLAGGIWSMLPHTASLVPIVHPSWIMQGNYKYLHVTRWDVGKMVRWEKQPFLTQRSTNIVQHPNGAITATKDLFYHHKPAFITFDIETSLRCVGFSSDKSQAHTFVLDTDTGPNRYAAEMVKAIRNIFEKCFLNNIPLVAQNGLFDIEVLSKPPYNIPLEHLFNLAGDTMYAHQLLFPELPHGLDFLTSVYTDIPYYKEEGRAFRIGIDPVEQFFNYNGMDCMATYESWEHISQQLEQTGQMHFFKTIILPNIRVLFLMKQRGLQVSTGNLGETVRMLNYEEIKTRCKLQQKVQYDPNPRSPTDMKFFLTDILGLSLKDLPKTTLTKKVKTDEDSLRTAYAKTGHTAILDVLHLRSTLQLRSHFTHLSTDARGRFHAAFKFGPKSGRLASAGEGRGPQLQNIPVHLKYGPGKFINLRRIFVAGRGRKLVEFDLEQADVRCVAYIAPEPLLISLFESADSDIHAQTCAAIFERDRATITKDDPERYLAKRLVHASNYGLGARKFAKVLREEGIFISEERAKELQARYLDKFPGILRYQQKIRALITSTRTVFDLFGRRSIFLDSFEDDKIFREAFSRPPQGTVASLMLKIMAEFQKCLDVNFGLNYGQEDRPFIVAQVHDSLVVDTPIAYEQWTIDTLGAIINAQKLTAEGGEFVIPAEFKTGDTWGELKKIG